jgi:tRNA threonylcarbamoyladenosine biosynthesis protein TsaE
MSSPEVLLEVRSQSPAETEELGRRLGELLEAGQGVALRGELGAGKTLLVRGLARGLGVTAAEEVRSPTYVLMMEHPGRVPLLHVDAYFAQRGLDFLADGGGAYWNEAAVVAVEWAERLAVAVPDEFLTVEIEHRGPQSRRIILRGKPELWRQRVDRLRS